MRIEVHIDRVVLDGVAEHRHAAAIEEALRARLTELVTAAPEATWGESRRRISAPPVAAGSPGSLGRDVAASVHNGLTGQRRGDR